MNKRFIFILGVLSFGFALFFSIIYFLERTAFLDLSFHLFYLLKDNDYCIQNYRIGAVFTQSFPLIGAWLGLSLKSIAILYSTSFIVLYALTFFCILVGFKNVKLAIIYLFFCILITTHTFFWAQSELPQGVAYLFIYLCRFVIQTEYRSSSFFKV